tara:strand:+ start:2673 stop:2897 length:225 start_codon:yes stop_codon:yes gene_type:complete
MTHHSKTIGTDIGFLIGSGLIALTLVSWIRHLIWTIGGLATDTLEGGQIALAVIGTFIPPIGAIHGFLLLFGWV